MHKLLDTSTAAIPTGVSPQRKLLRINFGVYAGRLVCLYGKSASEISLSWADPPHRTWSTPVNMIDDSADYPLSACMDGNGNIYLAYTKQTTHDLVFVKLAFYAGFWNTGSPVTILNVESAFYPSLVIADSGELWCAFAFYDSVGGNYQIRVKQSTDGGITWGSGPSDTGLQLSGSLTVMPYVNLSAVGSNLYAVYSEERSNLYYRRYNSSSQQWEAAVLIISSDYIDWQFDCAVAADMRLGIVISPSEAGYVYFRELDGVTMSGLQEAAPHKSRAPQIVYGADKPIILYARDIGNGYFIPCYAIKDNGSFSAAELSAGIGLFDKVFVYDDSAQTKHEDKTAEASSSQPADIYHSSSGALIADVQDCLYIGKTNKFFCVAIVLSTSASGGSVVWEYYNGAEWVSFSPQSGDYNFDQNDKLVFLWNDLESVPAEWRSSSINSEYMFWVRARVESAFTTAPVGTQIVASPRSDHLTLSREGK